jgi:hypothetical protein
MRESARRRSLPSDRCARGDETERGQQSMCLQTGTAHMPGDATIRSEPPARSLAWPLRAPPNDASLLKTRVLGALAELAGLRTLRLCPSYCTSQCKLAISIGLRTWGVMALYEQPEHRHGTGVGRVCVCAEPRKLRATGNDVDESYGSPKLEGCFGVSPRTPPTLILMQDYP